VQLRNKTVVHKPERELPLSFHLAEGKGTASRLFRHAVMFPIQFAFLYISDNDIYYKIFIDKY
jgi:hypothetical protein